MGVETPGILKLPSPCRGILSPTPQAVTNPTNTVYATKRLIGRSFKDEQTQKEMKVGQYVDSPSGVVKVFMEGPPVHMVQYK